MNEEDITAAVFAALAEIAPEIDDTMIDRHADLRDQADLDSMDFLNFVVGLHERLDIDIPEADYSRLATVDSCIAYLASRV